MKNSKNNKYRFLYKTPDSRTASLNKRNGVVLLSKFKESIEKDKYDAFVDSYKGRRGIFSTLRDKFHQVQGDSYKKHPGILSRVVSCSLTYVPKIKHTGNFLSKLPDTWKKYGVEINDEAYRVARKNPNIKVFHTSIEKLNTNIKYDFIRASHVIEHVDNPVVFLKKIKKLAKPKGRVLIYTPNTNSVSFKVFNKFWFGYKEKTHVRLYSVRNLEKLSRKLKFKVIESGSYYMGISVGSFMNYLNIKEGGVISLLLFGFLFVVLFPFSFIVNKLKLGGALYLLLEK